MYFTARHWWQPTVFMRAPPDAPTLQMRRPTVLVVPTPRRRRPLFLKNIEAIKHPRRL